MMLRGRRWLTPASILSGVAVLAVAFALFAPQSASDDGHPSSTYSTSLGGARGLYDVLQRLGFPVERRTVSMAEPLDSSAVYLVLQPSIPLTAVELSSVLSAVRRGGTIVFTGGRGALDDSLGFQIQPALDGFHTIVSTAVAGGESAHRDTHRDIRRLSRDALRAIPISATVTLSRGTGVRDTAFMWLVDSPTYTQDERRPQPARALVLGRTFGKGHAIAISTADLITNRLMRDGRPAIAIVHALEWTQGTKGITGGSATRVVFDEYHHGFGTHADVIGAVEHALISTTLGRMMLQGAAAAIILILAVGARPLSPVASRTVQRRSPLEHVGALAHAYLQVDARRIGTERLVRGLRRRHPLGMAGSVSHEAYLTALRTQLPNTAPDIAVVAAAIAPDSNQPKSFATVGAAIANIERTFPR